MRRSGLLWQQREVKTQKQRPVAGIVGGEFAFQKPSDDTTGSGGEMCLLCTKVAEH